MSVGPLGNTNALSGTSQELTNQARRASSDLKAEFAAGVGEMDADHEAGDRDADGRRPWELHARKSSAEESSDQTDTPAGEESTVHSKDVTGQSGGMLDLLG